MLTFLTQQFPHIINLETTCTQGDIWKFSVALIFDNRKLKRHTCPLTGEWINTVWRIYTMDC